MHSPNWHSIHPSVAGASLRIGYPTSGDEKHASIRWRDRQAMPVDIVIIEYLANLKTTARNRRESIMTGGDAISICLLNLSL